MRPNRPQFEENLRYRRRRDTGRLSALKIGTILTIAIGLVAGALILTNTYDFNSTSEPTDTANSQNRVFAPGDSGSGIDTSDGFGSSSANSGAGSIDGQSSESTTGDTGASSSSNTSTDNRTSGPSGTGGQTVAAGCAINGRVTDVWGASMVGTRVFATTADGTIVESVTDSRGRYKLPSPTPDAVSMSISLAHMKGSGSSFAVMVGDDVITLSTAIDPQSASCEVNFDSWNIQEQMVASPISTDIWPDAATIYQYTLNAETLAISLGADLDNSATLQIQAWCEDLSLGCSSSQRGAYFIAENELEENSPPIIVMLPDRSSAQSPGIPDNREYHEYGHYFLSLQAGDNFELPTGDANHGGYYKNSSTRDSFVEGFAEFYSIMVSRQIGNDQNAEMYTIGADYDLEADRLPWEAAGWWEEFTVAGLLLDFVDDDSDYAADPSALTGVSILKVTTDAEPSGTIVSGSIVNSSPLIVRNADVTVRYLNKAGEVVGTQVTRILPEVIAPTREGTFFAAPPAGLDVVQATATLGGISKSDDDKMAIGLPRLMSLISEYERVDGKLGVSNVVELYDALQTSNESQSGSNAGLAEIDAAQVDELFVSHGFFADLDGDRLYNPDIDGDIGASSHPVTEIGGVSYSAFIPRENPDGFDGSFVTINTGDANVDAVIQISIPSDGGSRSYAYVAPRGGSGQVEMAVPPGGQNAAVTIITAGKGYRPVIAFRVEADDFYEKIENGTISELQVSTVELEAGASVKQPDTSDNTIQLGVMLGGIVAILLLVASLIAIRRQWGKS